MTLHQRICGANNSCAIKQVKSTLNEEIKLKILRKAALMKKKKMIKIQLKIIKIKKLVKLNGVETVEQFVKIKT